jgi:hypothetical protein
MAVRLANPVIIFQTGHNIPVSKLAYSSVFPEKVTIAV